MTIIPNFDEVKFFLGNLCKRNHNWNNTEKSLRYKSDTSCFDCRAITSRTDQRKEYCAKYYRNPEKKEIIKKSKDKYKKSEKGRKTQLEGVKRYRQSEKGKALIQKYKETGKTREWENNYKNREDFKERYNASRRRYYHSLKGQVAHKKYVNSTKGRVALKNVEQRRRLRFINVPKNYFSATQWIQRCQEFNNSCAYCGECLEVKNIRQDHFIPIILNGSHCLSNLIPACQSCNSSKQGKHPFEWYPTYRKYNKERWDKILVILGIKE